MTTNTGYGLSFATSDIPEVGVKAAGVKGMKLKDDYLVSVYNFSYTTHEFISLITTKGTGKRIRLSEFDLSTRTRRGIQVIREVKSNPYVILKTFITDSRNYLGIKNGDINTIKITELPINDRYSTGSNISKKDLTDAFVVCSLEKPREKQETLLKDSEIEEVEDTKKIPKKDQISLEEIDDRLMTIDDFLK